MKNKFIYFLTLLIVTLCSCTPNNKAKESSIELTALYENVWAEQVPSLLKEYNVPCIGIGIIENGEIEYTKVFGEHQLEKKPLIIRFLTLLQLQKQLLLLQHLS